MWEVTSALTTRVEDVQRFLKQGYEPFSVMIDKYGNERIWLKREVKDEILQQQPRPKQRRIRKTINSAKE